jgi:hypothetical protein
MPYRDSEAFREACEANKAKDVARLGRILDHQIATTSGSEKAFWLALRFEKRIGTYRSLREYQTAWTDLYEMLCLSSPGDPGMANTVTNMALHVYLMLERSNGMETLLPMLRQSLHHLSFYHIRATLARLALVKRRWYSAYRHFTLAREQFEASPANFQEGQKCKWHFYFARRASAAVALGWLDKAEADIARSRAIRDEYRGSSLSPHDLGLAEAALAYAQRRFVDARAALQFADAQPITHARWPSCEVDFLLMAARIARAEGNTRSFEHFSLQALEICREQNLPLSAAAVNAVMNGAEY